MCVWCVLCVCVWWGVHACGVCVCGGVCMCVVHVCVCVGGDVCVRVYRGVYVCRGRCTSCMCCV